MQKDIAVRMLKAALDLDTQIGELDGLVSELGEGPERRECASALGNIIGIITKDFIFRVVRQYPELDPDK
jgi:hypothetical protein